jgi:hypothetical protein
MDDNEKAGSAFVVTGSGAKALQNAHAIFVGSSEPATAFSSEQDLSLVFFSRMSGRYVHIDPVEIGDHVFTVKYRFVPHNTRDSTIHFAIIPIGQLTTGQYEIKIEQLPPVDKKGMLTSPIADPDRIVSQGFSFLIKE